MAVAAGLFFVLHKSPPPESVLAQSVNPPALFAAAPGPCRERAPEAALSLASEELVDADSKAERAPFYPGDGLMAVHHYERAAACLKQAGQADRAREATRAAEQLKRELADQLHVHHLRLERLLVQAKYEEGARELAIVSSYVEDRTHPYAHWLSAVKRELELHNNVPQGG